MVPRAMENLKLWVLELGVDSWWEGCEPVAVLWIHRVSEPFVLGSFLNVLGIVWEYRFLNVFLKFPPKNRTQVRTCHSLVH